MAAMTVRRATPDDGDEIVAMAAGLSQEEAGQGAEFTAAAFRRDGFGPDAAFATLIAEHHGLPVGYAIYYPAYDTESASRGAYLQDLYVTPEARRRRAGRKLVSAVARAVAARGGNWLFWSAIARNRQAGGFYFGLGRPLDGAMVYVADGADFDALLEDLPDIEDDD